MWGCVLLKQRRNAWFIDLLIDRSQFVRLNCTMSDLFLPLDRYRAVFCHHFYKLTTAEVLIDTF